MENTMEGLAYELSPAERKDVRDRYPKTYFPDPVKEPLFWGRRNLQRIGDKFAVVDQRMTNTETGLSQPTVFGICSDQYKIVPFEDVIHLTEQSVGQLTDYGKIQICPHTYLSGARLNIGIKFPDHQLSIKPGENIIPKVNVFSSYDLSTKLMGRFGAFQLKCLNGAGIWKSFKSFAKRHLQNLFLNELGNNISEGMALFGGQVESWRRWTELKLDQKLYDTVWDELPFSAAERVKIEALPEIGTGLQLGMAIKGNSLDLWSLSSVLTQWSTHNVKSELRRIDLEPAIARVMDLTFDKAVAVH